MAFIKRNWLARIGIGLNKFIIGDKDGEGKQTLTNSPDSVTQAGDVISADNLNDLEDRIADEFDSMETNFHSIKLTKVWENEHPDQDYGGYPMPRADIGDDTYDFIIEYRTIKTNNGTMFAHFHMPDSSASGNLIDVNVWGSGHELQGRDFDFRRVGSGGVYHSELAFYDCYSFNGSTYTTENNCLIPVAVYKVGNIYNT